MLLRIFLTLTAVLCLVLLAIQIEQHIFRHRAQKLLDEIESIELRKTRWQEALVQFTEWAAYRKLDDRCTDQKCSLEIRLDDLALGFFSNLSVHLDDYLRWRLRLSYDIGPIERAEAGLLKLYMVAGGRPAMVVATIGMRDGTVWSKGFFIGIETYWHDVPDFYGSHWEEYTLFADAHSESQLNRHGPQPSQLTLHPNFIIGRPGGCEICILGWVHFTPYADPVDIHRLMQLDLSCLTRIIRPCLTQNDIMPNTWAQHLDEDRHLSALSDQAVCSPSFIETLGRDSANVARAEIVAYKEGASTSYAEARVKILENLKGPAHWKAGETYGIELTPTVHRAIRLGSEIIIFLDTVPGFKTWSLDMGSACSPLPSNEENLSLVRLGIDQDYDALDRPEQ